MKVLDKVIDEAEQDVATAQSVDASVEAVLPSLERILDAWDDPARLSHRLRNIVAAGTLAAIRAGDQSSQAVPSGLLMAAAERRPVDGVSLDQQLTDAAAAFEHATAYAAQRESFNQYAAVVGQRLGELLREREVA